MMFKVTPAVGGLGAMDRTRAAIQARLRLGLGQFLRWLSLQVGTDNILCTTLGAAVTLLLASAQMTSCKVINYTLWQTSMTQ